jgi:hypothetical protein
LDADEIVGSSTSNTIMKQQWNVTEASTLLHYMDHVCTPRADMSAVFKDLKPENPFEGINYQRQLKGKYIADGSYNLENRKLFRFLKNVILIYTQLSKQTDPTAYNSYFLLNILIGGVNILIPYF